MREQPLIAPLECTSCAAHEPVLGTSFRAGTSSRPSRSLAACGNRDAQHADDAERGPSPWEPLPRRRTTRVRREQPQRPSRIVHRLQQTVWSGRGVVRGSRDGRRRQRTSSVRGGCGRRRARVTPHDRHTERYNPAKYRWRNIKRHNTQEEEVRQQIRHAFRGGGISPAASLPYRSSEYGCPRLPSCGGCSCEAGRCVCERVRCRPPSASAEGHEPSYHHLNECERMMSLSP